MRAGSTGTTSWGPSAALAAPLATPTPYPANVPLPTPPGNFIPYIAQPNSTISSSLWNSNFFALEQQLLTLWGAYNTDVVFPVLLYGAKCNTVTGSGGYVSGADDTLAIQAAVNAAATAGGGTVQLPGAGANGVTGKCAISSQVFLGNGAHRMVLAGAGKFASALVAMPNYSMNTALTPVGGNGQLDPMIDLDAAQAPPTSGYTPPQTPFTDSEIRDLTIDPRAWTNTQTAIEATVIGVSVRAVQRITVRNVNCDLGAPITFTDQTKGFTCMAWDQLSFDPANPSHDLQAINVTCHNGVGCVQWRTGAGCTTTESSVTDQVWNLRIQNETDVIDLGNIEDDRDVVSASSCGTPSTGPTAPGIRSLIDDGQQVYIAPTVTSGGVNGLKVEPTSGNKIIGVSFTNWDFVGSPNGGYTQTTGGVPWATGSPFAGLDASGNGTGILRDITIAHGHAEYAANIPVGPDAESGASRSVTVEDVTMQNALFQSCITLAATQPPTGYERVTIRDSTCMAAPAAIAHYGASTMLGFQIAGAGSPSNGFQGAVTLSNDVAIGYGIPWEVANCTCAGAIVSNVRYDAGTPQTGGLALLVRDSGAIGSTPSFGVFAGACSGGVAFTNGVAFYSNAGAPACTAPKGSLYLRSDGAVGSTLYVSQGGGTWNASAGV
ncbi:MAG TPA: hypothetical protein VFB22_01200 [Candidatus Baltobacteraceae bacterium]|nr:hypothetical protein [Candidatus Baltobacteraceae bacterium]